MPIQQPQGIKQLTNIVVVRVKRGGEKFEIACYPDKVDEWRKGAYVVLLL